MSICLKKKSFFFFIFFLKCKKNKNKMSKSKEKGPQNGSSNFLLLVNFCVIVFLIYKRYKHLQKLDKEEEKNVGYYEFFNQIYNICLIYNLLLVFDLENTNLKLISFINSVFLIMVYTESTPTTSKEFNQDKDKTILYTKLGVEPNADKSEISRAYRKKSIEYKKCEQKLKEECAKRQIQINIINEILVKNDELKKEYDRSGFFIKDICNNEIDDPNCVINQGQNEEAYYPKTIEKSWLSSFF